MTTDRDIEISYPLPEFIAELRRLADTLESGEHFEIDGEQISIGDNAIFSIEHEREDGCEEIAFQLSWDLLDDEDDEDEDENEDPDEDEDEAGGEAESETDAEPTSTPA